MAKTYKRRQTEKEITQNVKKRPHLQSQKKLCREVPYCDGDYYCTKHGNQPRSRPAWRRDTVVFKRLIS